MLGIINRYWVAYGGWNALIKSPYIYIALTLSALMFPAWSKGNWEELALSIMPGMLGFSLGGYALLIAIGDEKFRALISGEKEDGRPSPYMQMNATFVHFIFMQLLTIFYALVVSAYRLESQEVKDLYEWLRASGLRVDVVWLVANFTGYSLFIYALLTVVAATIGVLRVSSWYDHKQTLIRKKEQQDRDQEQQESQPLDDKQIN